MWKESIGAAGRGFQSPRARAPARRRQKASGHEAMGWEACRPAAAVICHMPSRAATRDKCAPSSSSTCTPRLVHALLRQLSRQQAGASPHAAAPCPASPTPAPQSGQFAVGLGVRTSCMTRLMPLGMRCQAVAVQSFSSRLCRQTFQPSGCMPSHSPAHQHRHVSDAPHKAGKGTCSSVGLVVKQASRAVLRSCWAVQRPTHSKACKPPQLLHTSSNCPASRTKSPNCSWRFETAATTLQATRTSWSFYQP